jgi:hypothetical protein
VLNFKVTLVLKSVLPDAFSEDKEVNIDLKSNCSNASVKVGPAFHSKSSPDENRDAGFPF